MVESLHNILSHKVLVWLDNRTRAIRGATEICLKEGYIADAVAVAGLPTRLHARYGLNGQFTFHTFCFEVKTTRSDFLSTFNNSPKHANRKESVCNFHYIVAPRDMIAPLEVPGFWGLLCNSGRGLREIKLAVFQDNPLMSRLEIEGRLLWVGKLTEHIGDRTFGYRLRRNAIYVGAWHGELGEQKPL